MLQYITSSSPGAMHRQTSVNLKKKQKHQRHTGKDEIMQTWKPQQLTQLTWRQKNIIHRQ